LADASARQPRFPVSLPALDALSIGSYSMSGWWLAEAGCQRTARRIFATLFTALGQYAPTWPPAAMIDIVLQDCCLARAT
jgi:hypothetical protein